MFAVTGARSSDALVGSLVLQESQPGTHLGCTNDIEMDNSLTVANAHGALNFLGSTTDSTLLYRDNNNSSADSNSNAVNLSRRAKILLVSTLIALCIIGAGIVAAVLHYNDNKSHQNNILSAFNASREIPTISPSLSPSSEPTSHTPSHAPTLITNLPTLMSHQPSSFPSPADGVNHSPTHSPSLLPSLFPTTIVEATSSPTTIYATMSPSSLPTAQPTVEPSAALIDATRAPVLVSSPTQSPTDAISQSPTLLQSPTLSPTVSLLPTPSPSFFGAPTVSLSPTNGPTVSQFPTQSPTRWPTTPPTSFQPIIAAHVPTAIPTSTPSKTPTAAPTDLLSLYAPTIYPTTASLTNSLSMYKNLVGALSPSSVSYTELQMDAGYIDGGMQKWNSFFSGILSDLRSGKVVESIKFQQIIGNSTSNTSLNLTCYGDISNQVIDQVILGSANVSTFVCGSNTYRIEQCTSGIVAIGINTESNICGSAFDCRSTEVILNSLGSCTDRYSARIVSLSVSYRNSIKEGIIYPLSSSILASTATSIVVNTLSNGTSAGQYKLCCGIFSYEDMPDTLLWRDIAVQSQCNISTGAMATDEIESKEVSISGLLPLTEYNVLCANVLTSMSGELLTTVINPALAVSASTSCCRSASLVINNPLIAHQRSHESTVSVSSITLSFSQYPSSAVVASIAISSSINVSQVLEAYIFPPTIVVSRQNATGLIFDFDVVVVPLSNIVANWSEIDLQVSLILSGPSADEFDVAIPPASAIRLVNSDLVGLRLPPSLTAATFHSSGKFVSVWFDGPTDGSSSLDLSSAAAFQCSKLFDFSSNALNNFDSLLCQWRDKYFQSLLLSVSYDSTLVVGNYISLKPGVIRATSCANFVLCPFSNNSSLVQIAAPDTMSRPIVVMNVPAVVSRCSQIPIDISASSGSGGRKWSTSSTLLITCPTCPTGMAATLASISSKFLSALATEGGVAILPPGLLLAGYVYFIDAQLCNSFLVCGYESVSFIVLSQTIPTVNLFGPAVRTVYQGQQLSLSIDTYRSSCSNLPSRNNLTIAWSAFIVSGNVTVSIPLISSSIESNQFSLPANTLLAAQSYIFVMKVVDSLTSSSFQSKIAVLVEEAPLVAVIRGGKTRFVRLGVSFWLSASQSNYKDQLLLPLDNRIEPSLVFSWSCRQYLPLPTAVCGLDRIDGDMRQGDIGFIATVVGSNMVNVLVSDGIELSTASVSVTVINETAPVIELFALDSLGTESFVRLDLTQRNYIVGSLGGLDAGSMRGSYSWSCLDAVGNEVDMLVIADSPVSSDLQLRPGMNTSNVYLSLPPLNPESVTAGSYLTFMLVYGSVQSSITVAVNTGPLPGKLLITPTSGVAYTTIFILQAINWGSDYLPLRYAWFSRSCGVCDDQQVISLTSAQSFNQLLLPSGMQNEDYLLTIEAHIMDSLSATALADSTVTVKPSNNLTIADINSIISHLFDVNEGSIGGQLRSLLVGASLFNAKGGCVAQNASYCSSLHRQSCSVDSGLCGLCLDGYTGEPNPANSVCNAVLSLPLTSKALSASVVGQDAELKNCLDDCTDSTAGQCTFLSLRTGRAQASCESSDSSCVAVCRCNAPFAGTSCSVMTEEQASRNELRTALLVQLASQVEDLSLCANCSIDSHILISLSNSLSKLSAGDNGETAISEYVPSILMGLLELSSHYQLDSSYIHPWLQVLDNILLPPYSGQGQSLYDYRQYLEYISQIVWKDMVESQYDLYSSQVSFDMVNKIITVKSSQAQMTELIFSSDSSGSGAMLTLPKGDYVLKMSYVVNFPAGFTTDWSDRNVTTEIVTLYFSDLSMCQDRADSCNLTVRLESMNALNTADASVEATASVTQTNNLVQLPCVKGVNESVIFNGCASGFPLTVTCDGTWSGYWLARCPVTKLTTSCYFQWFVGADLQQPVHEGTVSSLSNSTDLLNCSLSIAQMVGSVSVTSGVLPSAVTVFGFTEEELVTEAPVRVLRDSSSGSAVPIGLIIGLTVSLIFVCIICVVGALLWKYFYKSDSSPPSAFVPSSLTTTKKLAKTVPASNATTTSLNPAYQKIPQSRGSSNQRKAQQQENNDSKARKRSEVKGVGSDSEDSDIDFELGQPQIRSPRAATRSPSKVIETLSAAKSSTASLPGTDRIPRRSLAASQAVDWKQAAAVELAAQHGNARRSNVSPSQPGAEAKAITACESNNEDNHDDFDADKVFVRNKVRSPKTKLPTADAKITSSALTPEPSRVQSGVHDSKNHVGSIQARLSNSTRKGLHSQSTNSLTHSAPTTPTFTRPASRPFSPVHVSEHTKKQDPYMKELLARMATTSPSSQATFEKRSSATPWASTSAAKLSSVPRGTPARANSVASASHSSLSPSAPIALHQRQAAKTNSSATAISLPATTLPQSQSSTIIIEIGNGTRMGSSAVYTRLPPLVPIPIVSAVESVDHCGDRPAASNSLRGRMSSILRTGSS